MTKAWILVIVPLGINTPRIITQRQHRLFQALAHSSPIPMIVGTEWLIEAEGCDQEHLRDESLLRDLFARVIEDLGLKTLGAPHWHKFPGEAGVTGLVMLTESHLACHTFPEHGIGTFNLYCCRARPEWNWDENLRSMFGASDVRVTRIDRGRRSDEDAQTMMAGGEA